MLLQRALLATQLSQGKCSLYNSWQCSQTALRSCKHWRKLSLHFVPILMLFRLSVHTCSAGQGLNFSDLCFGNGNLSLRAHKTLSCKFSPVLLLVVYSCQSQN